MMPPRFTDIEELLDEVVTLPSISASLERLTELIANPNCSLSDVAKAISTDPSIALKALRLVNSAYYGLGQEVLTVEHAVVLLGLKVIKNLALTATVFDTFGERADRLLRHCVSCGVAMRVLAETGPLRELLTSADEAFVFGLLHDIGKVILLEYLPAEYGHVQDIVKNRRIPWFKAEHECIGVDHSAVGARLAEKWKLSESIVVAIRAHHDLDQSNEAHRVLSATLTVADYLCSAAGLASYENPSFDIPEAVWQAAGLDTQATARVVENYFKAIPNVEELIQIAS